VKDFWILIILGADQGMLDVVRSRRFPCRNLYLDWTGVRFGTTSGDGNFSGFHLDWPVLVLDWW